MKFSFSSFSLSFLLACTVVDATYDIERSLDDTCDGTGTDFDERSSVITNDIPWVDNCGDKIKANRGGTISEKIGDYYYMIGSESKPLDPEVNDDAGTIYIYRSKNLGSNSWEFVQKIKGKKAQSCAMNYNPSTNKVVVHCRKLICVADDPEGKFDCSRVLNVGDNTRKVGGSSMFRQGNDLYFVTSRAQKKDTIPVNQKPNRFVVVYKLKEDWLEVKETTVEWKYNSRESPYIVEHEEDYYLFTSRSAGWKNSTTRYLRAGSLEGLNDAGEGQEVTFYPENTDKIKSMGTQFTFAQKFGDENGEERYMFGGRHHPLEDPCNFAPQWGSHKMAPLRFDDEGIPVVYWKKSFDWKTYAYDPPTYDQPDKEYYQPVCEDKPGSEKFYAYTDKDGNDQEKGCPWVARKKTEKRCNQQPGTIAHCQATCSDYCDYTEGGTCNKFCDYTESGFCLK